MPWGVCTLHNNFISTQVVSVYIVLYQGKLLCTKVYHLSHMKYTSCGVLCIHKYNAIKRSGNTRIIFNFYTLYITRVMCMNAFIIIYIT